MGKALRGLRSRSRLPLALACAAAVLGTFLVAWRQPGFAEVPPAPDDLSVWVMNDSRLLVGRINTGIASWTPPRCCTERAKYSRTPRVRAPARWRWSTRPSTNSNCWTPRA